MKVNSTGTWIAASAAILFCSGCGPDAAEQTETANIQCDGANACKGQSECATADSQCNGLNSCNGKGWVSLSAEECEQAGGIEKTG